jgi:hypothetical protein
MIGMKAACIALLITSFLALGPDTVVHKCLITVTDSQGAVIGLAHIFVHRDPLATALIPDLILDADKDGKLELLLHDGNYDLCVMSPAFTPTCRKLVVRKNDLSSKFRLRPSPEVLEQTGDKFSTQ